MLRPSRISTLEPEPTVSRWAQLLDGGVTTADGTTIGVGDVVVTRLNVRALSTGRGWVKNGDDWIVRETRDDGSVRLTRPNSGEVAILPATYVAEHLELGYASTAHRAQGRTVDTAHAYVTATTTREPLYVMATRGRESNRMYVDTAHDPDDGTRHSEPEHADPDEVLRNVIATTGADSSATQTRRAEARGTGAVAHAGTRGGRCGHSRSVRARSG